jgi:Zn-dependent protease
MLPPASNEFQSVQREIAQIDARLNPQSKPDWRKRLGPFGVIVAFLAKFKGAIFALAKFKMFFSLFAFFGVYWAMFGWWFAVGMCASIFIHEMGHYVAVRRFGYSAELPMFIPGFGAYVKWNGPGVDLGTRAVISLSGPLFGFLSGILSLAIYFATGNGVWLAVAHFAGWLNLLNLIPVGIFDGGSAVLALGRQEKLGLVVVSAALALLLQTWLPVFVGAGAAFQLWRGQNPPDPRRRIGLFFIGLVIANACLSRFSEILWPGH